MAAALPFLQIAGTVMSVIGALNQSQSQSRAAEYNAQVAQQNATIAQQQGAAAADAQHRNAVRQIGAMQANYGASGVDATTGSPLDVLQDSVRSATLDNLTTQYNYNLRSLGYQNQAALNNYQASSSRSSGVLKAIGAGVQGATGYVKGGFPLPFGLGGVDKPEGWDNSFDNPDNYG